MHPSHARAHLDLDLLVLAIPYMLEILFSKLNIRISTIGFSFLISKVSEKHIRGTMSNDKVTLV